MSEISATALVIAGLIAHIREKSQDTVDCLECRGTGAHDPDCDLCKGEQYVNVRRLYALGWRKGDLYDVEDGYARCPRDGCEGDSCSFCEGDGKVPRHEQAQQVRRALIYAKYRQCVPLLTFDSIGRRRKEDQLLSWEAARSFYSSGVAMRLNSVFGTEFYWTGTDEQWLEAWRRASRIAATERLLVNAGEKHWYWGEKRHA